MKKNYISLLFIILGLFQFIRCNDFLNKNPLSEISPETFFQAKSDMNIWNAGIYDGLQKALISRHLEWGDLRSDSYYATKFGDDKLYINALDATMVQASWEQIYRCINLCNVAIESYPNIPNITENEYGPYIGQAYGIRALMYFYGIRVWGKMPLVIHSWDGDLLTSYIPRSPIEEVKKQILDDIDQAIYFLVSDVSRKYYFNKAAAYALKTDVHMWFKEYVEAIQSSDYFMGNANFQLVQNAAEWKTMLLNPLSSKESVFNLNFEFDENEYNWWGLFLGYLGGSRWKMSNHIFYEFVDRLRSGNGSDGRFWNTLDTVQIFYEGQRIPISYDHHLQPGAAICIKYSDMDPDRKFDAENNIYKSYWKPVLVTNCEIKLPIYRLADVLLLRAEALNKTGDTTGALRIVNQIRGRVGYFADAASEVQISDQDGIEALILKERQLEFFGEGKRWFDLIRTDRLMEVMDPIIRERQQSAGSPVTGFTKEDEGRKYFPIYYQEFEANPALRGDQNPPYSEG